MAGAGHPTPLCSTCFDSSIRMHYAQLVSIPLPVKGLPCSFVDKQPAFQDEVKAAGGIKKFVQVCQSGFQICWPQKQFNTMLVTL